jgi:hypothetical protein
MPTRSKPRNAANPIEFHELAALIGVPENDPAVVSLLERAGKVQWENPYGRSRYVHAKEAGFELILQVPNGKSHSARKRVDIITIFGAVDGYTKFARPPFGITFTSRAAVVKKLPASLRSYWQANRKDVFDVFEIDGMHVGVTTKGLRVANIVVKSLAGPTGGII